ncbi:MAG: hypothetical protein CVV24_10070 [Ignavibacteriae bacterium HGW-Ignavibacteriae-3]|nr:MAG: hypothetical protein CVV24_10070 [Ignavibacteriae bacterium HGW-Ignavibacteriae-3]
MITALIFTAHIIFMAVIFTKKWQDESLSSAFINLALIVILFAVGWSISTSLVKLVIDSKGFGIQFDADAISLTVLIIFEFFFYRFYYRDDKSGTQASTEDDKEM